MYSEYSSTSTSESIDELVCNEEEDDAAALPVRHFASSDRASMNKRLNPRLQSAEIPSRSRRTSIRYACFPM